MTAAIEQDKLHHTPVSVGIHFASFVPLPPSVAACGRGNFQQKKFTLLIGRIPLKTVDEGNFLC